MKTLTRIMILGLTAGLVACNGGSDATTGPSDDPPPPPADQRPGGLWYGTLTSDAFMGTEDIVGMVSEDGRFRLISGDTAWQMSGTVTVAGTALTGSGKAIAGPGSTWPDGSTVGDVSLTATIAQRDSMSGAFSTTATDSGTFELFYDPYYERASDLSLLEGLWTAYDDVGNPEVTFAIQPSGAFDGQNAQGCVSNGQISLIDARYDLYDVQSTISGCGIAGDYNGMAFVGDLTATNDALIFAIDNGSFVILLGLLK